MNENSELLLYIYKNADMGVKSTTELIRLLNQRDNKIKNVVEENKKLVDVPITVSLIEKNVTSIIDNKYEKYLDGIKYYISDNTKIYLKSSGIVTFIGEKEGYGNTVIVQQSDGYYAWYGNINESIKLYDYVESGSEIGESSGEYYYALFKDDKPVDIFDEN